MRLPAPLAAALEALAALALPARGARVAGARDGLWTQRLPGGRILRETTWRNGRRHGRERCWYLDGKPHFHGTWTDGRRTGEWIFLTRDERVDPERTGVYENGEKIAPVRGYNDWKH